MPEYDIADDPNPIEAALAAQKTARNDYLISGCSSGNGPCRVYRMRGAHEDDKPSFVGALDDCQDLVDKHAIRAGIAAYLRAQLATLRVGDDDV